MANDPLWTEKIAEAVERRVDQRKGPGARIVCASGISPSGPIHLGNLREVMTVHLVVEELRRRGRDAEHIHSWDNFDRLRKIPVGVPESYGENIGRPIGEIPDPFGEFPSYADRYISEFEHCLDQLRIRPRYVRQSIAYRRGDYVEGILRAMDRREAIFDILAKYQDPGRFEQSVEERRVEYYPFQVYCESCQADETRITQYLPDGAGVRYTCDRCGHGDFFSLRERVPGKLVWKVDWPMRWKREGVDFEPGGEDHSSPGGSYTVGKRIVSEVYGGEAPHYAGYAFVGVAGRSKISSSEGSFATAGAALKILEAPILRWLYLRRNAGQKFNIDFGSEIFRLYDEWDRLNEKIAQGGADPKDAAIVERCLQTSSGPVEATALPVSYRLLASAADITQGDETQILRIVQEHLENPPAPETLKAVLEPRKTCAANWALTVQPEDERTRPRESFSAETWNGLSDEQRRGVALFLEQMDAQWTLEGLTRLVYGVPKQLAGLPLDAPPTPELKQSQRGFFIALYQLLVASDTGPRLPTLLLALGSSNARSLLAEG